MNWLKTLWRWLNWTIVIPTVVLLLLFIVLLYTNPGLQLVLKAAQYFAPQLSVNRADGSLLGGMSLHQVQWQQPQQQLKLGQLQLDIENRCFLRFSLCVNQLALNDLHLDVNTPDTETLPTEPVAENTSPFSLWLPFPASIRQLTLDNINLNINGSSLSWQHFSTEASAWGSKVQLDHTRLQQVRVSLPANDSEPSTEPFRYQPPQLADITMPLSLFISDFTLTDAVLLQPESHQELQHLHFRLQLQQQQISLTELDVRLPQAMLTGEAELNTRGDYPLQAAFSVTVKQGELTGQKLDTTIRGSLAALTVHATASQHVYATLNAQLALLSTDLPLQLELQAPQLQWPLSGEAQIQLADNHLQLSGDLAALNVRFQNQFSGQQLPAGKLNTTALITPEQIQLQQLTIDTLGGQLTTEATANWQHQLQWQARLALQHIQPGLFWPDYLGNFSGSFQHQGQLSDNGGWQLHFSQLALDGLLRELPLHLAGQLSVTDPGDQQYQLTSEQLVLSHGKNQLSLQGKLAEQWQLQLQLDIPQLSDTVAEAEGTFTGDIRLAGDRLQPELQAKIDGSELKWQDASLQQLSLNTELSLQQQLTATIQLEASGGRYQLQQLDNLTLAFNGSEQQHSLNVALQSTPVALELGLTGQFQRNSHWQGTLSKTRIGTIIGDWQLAQHAELHYQLADQQFRLGQHCWLQQQTRLCLDETQANPQQLHLQLALTDFDLSRLSPLLTQQTKVAGDLNATITTDWTFSELPQFSAEIQGNAGQVQQQLELPVVLGWHTFKLSSKLQQQQLDSSLSVQFSDDAQLELESQISNLLDDDKQLQARLQLQHFTLAFLQPLLDEYSELAGEINADIQAAGSLLSPELLGKLSLQQLKVKGKLAPTDIDLADIGLDFHGKQASLSGQLTTPDGKIKLNGSADWHNIEQWHSSVQIQGDELRLQIPQAHLKIAPDITLKVTATQADISGVVRIPFADISVDTLPQNAIGLSGDLVILDKNLQPITEETAGHFAVNTNVKVVLGERVKLSAFGLATSLRGELRVQQHPTTPVRVNGEVSLHDGTFRAYGQDLLIREGKMIFSGPPEQPYLNVEAIRNPANMEDDVIAGIRVTGPADEPIVSIFSEPSKPQANALSYLLMGRDLDSESGSTANAITTSLIGLGIASSGKLVGEIGEAFGIQDLTLDTAGAGDNTQVTISGYLSRDLQVKYGVGIFNKLGEFTLRYRVMRRLYLEAVSGLDNAVDLLYKFEFD